MRTTRLTRAGTAIAAAIGMVATAALTLTGPAATASEPEWQPEAAPDFERLLRQDQLSVPDLPEDFGEDSYLQRTYGYTYDEALAVLVGAGAGTAAAAPEPDGAAGDAAEVSTLAIHPDAGYEMWRPLIQISSDQGNLYYGAVVNFANASPEIPAYCLDLQLEGPQGGQGTSQVVDGQALHALVEGRYTPPGRYEVSPGELASLLAQYGEDAAANPVSVATLGLLTHANLEMAADADRYVGAYLAAWESHRTDRELGTTAEQRAAMVDSLIGWARAQTPGADGWTGPGVTIDADQRHGTVTDIGVRNERGGFVPGIGYTLTLTGPATFAGGQRSLTGTTTAEPIAHPIAITGNGSVSASVVYTYASAEVSYSRPEVAGVQRTLQSHGHRNVQKAMESDAVAATYDFRPTLASQTTSAFVEAGGQFVDDITLGADLSYDNPHWITIDDRYVPATVTTNVYWSLTPPAGASPNPPSTWSLVETVTQTFDGPGTRRIGVNAARPGYYVAQSVLSVADQPEQWRTYFAAGARYDFGLQHETQTARISPRVTTEASDRLALPGATLSDSVTIETNRGVDWPEGLSITAEGTLYGPFDTPLQQSPTIPKGSPVAATEALTFTADGQTLRATWVPEAPGFYTWVWRIDPAAQDDGALFAAPFTDDFMIHVETSSVRVPTLRHHSEAREYNVDADGRAFDTIEIAGFMDSHGDFAGDTAGSDYWGADLPNARVIVYDAGTDTDWTAVGRSVPAGAVIHWEDTVAAENGTFRIGYEDDHPITGFLPGHDYVFVYQFEGDDRVAAFTSPFDDIFERFHVPADRPAPPTVATQATGEVLVGEPFSDTALVAGDVPPGAYLVFEAFGPQQGAPTCDGRPLFTSDKIAVSGPGYYESGTTTAPEPGAVHWVETLRSKDGRALASGRCGAASETTRVMRPELATTASAATVEQTTGGPVTTIVDRVCYTNLITGRSYSVAGTLMDRATGRAIKDATGAEVTASATIDATTASGCVDMPFRADSASLAGRTTVAFEELWSDDVQLAVHADLDDAAQTTVVPGLATTATNADTGGKTVPASGEVRLQDRVCYTNLAAGENYTIAGTLMNSSTGGPIEDASGRAIVAEVTHRPAGPNGCANVLFTFDAAALGPLTGRSLVVFERVSLGTALVAVHADPSDAGQTVKIRSEADLARTGWNHPLLGALALAALGLGALALVAARRYRF